MKKARSSSSGLLPILTLLVLAGAGLGYVFTLNPDIDLKAFFDSGDKPQVVATNNTQVQILGAKDLQKELRANVIRVNRLTPYKPNLMLSLERVYVDKQPASVTFDYEISVAYEDMQFGSGAFRKALVNRYCTDDDLAFMAANGVRVTFRYMKMGRIIHEEVVDRCGQ